MRGCAFCLPVCPKNKIIAVDNFVSLKTVCDTTTGIDIRHRRMISRYMQFPPEQFNKHMIERSAGFGQQQRFRCRMQSLPVRRKCMFAHHVSVSKCAAANCLFSGYLLLKFLH
jgi:hypothetical protein